MHGRRNPIPDRRVVDLSGRTEHAAGGASPRAGSNADDTVSELREGGGGCSRPAGRGSFLCALADRLPDRPVRTGAARPAVGGGLLRPMGPAVFDLNSGKG